MCQHYAMFDILQACRSAMCCATMISLQFRSTHASGTRGGAWTEPDNMCDPVTSMQAFSIRKEQPTKCP
jgi:hypothetical protein